MSLFKGLMFTQDAPAMPLDFDRNADAFGPTYGNRIANEKALREAWGHRHDANCESACIGGCA